MKRIALLIAVITGLTLQVSAQDNYSFQLASGKFILIDGVVFALVNGKLKRYDNVHVERIGRNDWTSTNLQELLDIALRRQDQVTVTRFGEAYTLLATDTTTDLTSVYYFGDEDPAARNQHELPDEVVAELEDILTACEDDELPPWEKFCVQQPINDIGDDPADSTEYERLAILALKGLVINQQRINAGTQNNTFVMRFPYHFHRIIDPSNPVTGPLERVPLRKDDSYYLNLFSDPKKYFHPLLTCNVLNEVFKVFFNHDLALLNNRLESTAFRKFQILNGDGNEAFVEMMTADLIGRGFSGDTLVIDDFDNYEAAVSSTEIFLHEKYSDEPIIRMAGEIQEVIGHDAFPAFLRNLREPDMRAITTPLEEVTVLHDSAFYLKFTADNFYRAVYRDKSFRIRNFNLVVNKSETLALLAEKVSTRTIVEVKALDSHLFLLNGRELSVFRGKNLVPVTTHVADLNASLASTKSSFYIFQSMQYDSVNLVRMDKKTGSVKTVAFGLNRISMTTILTAFLNYNDGLTTWPSIHHWRYSADNAFLFVAYTDFNLVGSFYNGKAAFKKVDPTMPLKVLVNKPWIEPFLKYRNSEALWKIVFSSDSTPYFAALDTLHSLKGNDVIPYERIQIPALLEARHFLDEVNLQSPIDTIFTQHPADKNIAIVKYLREGFFRLYSLPDTASYVPIRISNYLSFCEDLRMVESLVGILESQKITDTISYSRVKDHHFLTSKARMYYYYPFTRMLMPVADKRMLAFEDDTEFLKVQVVDKVNRHRSENEATFTVSVEDSRGFQVSLDAETHHYLLYKFSDEGFYRMQLRFLEKGEDNATQDTSIITRVHMKDLAPVFSGDQQFMQWFLSNYKNNTEDVKCVAVAPEKNGDPYVIYDQWQFQLYTNGKVASYWYYSTCDLDFSFGGSFLNFTELDPDFDRIITALSIAKQDAGNYNVHGLSKYGIVFCEKEQWQECLDAEKIKDAGPVTFHIFDKKELNQYVITSDNVDGFLTDVETFLRLGQFDKLKYSR